MHHKACTGKLSYDPLFKIRSRLFRCFVSQLEVFSTSKRVLAPRTFEEQNINSETDSVRMTISSSMTAE